MQAVPAGGSFTPAIIVDPVIVPMGKFLWQQYQHAETSNVLDIHTLQIIEEKNKQTNIYKKKKKS